MSIGVEDHNGLSGKNDGDTEGDSIAGWYIGVDVPVSETSPTEESGEGAGKVRDARRSGGSGSISEREAREP